MNERECLVCDQLLRGRMDKKFCDDACRNHYHNAKNRVELKKAKRVHSKLKRNWRILAELAPLGSVTKSELLKRGFDFNHITRFEAGKNGKNHFFCYDQGYVVRNDGTIEFVSEE
jgi:hypothetical protein